MPGTGQPTATPPSAHPSPTLPGPSGSAADTAPALGTLYGDGYSGDYGSARIDVIGLERTAPDAVTARYRISAGQDNRPVVLEGLRAQGLAGTTPYDESRAFSGFFLLDDLRFAVYHPMKERDVDSSAHCLCSYPEYFAKATSGNPVLLWAVYRVPPETTSVAVGFQGAGLTAPLPIAAAGTGTPLEGEPDSATIGAYFPNTAPLTTRQYGLVSSVSEDAEQVEIVLNTDVLFEFDKAALTAAARDELRRTAGRIGTEATGTVQITGHTDDVGSDAYNQKLSLRRAESVRAALAALLPGAGVSFHAEGKGETRPAVKGHSAEDRARNRRVEVVFHRRATPAATPSPAAPTATDPAATGSPAAPIATAEGLRKLTGLEADVVELRRISSRALIATVDFRNTGTGEVKLEEGAWDPDVDRISGVYGHKTQFFWLTLSDSAQTRYFPLTTPGNDDFVRSCVCSESVSAKLGPGKRIRQFVLLTAPPAEVTTVDVHLYGFTPLKGLPVS
ncbi:OmpA family protein [Microtetraspora sp. AC03309]|uniref:OmpA family protein n=1 Tax=Microtetraspora sp. AC03309 TaxID=2779376 RepID=UPI001E3D9108|nr:OmpA family protein [Microtetraspora sp. AC03309]MCC5579044.1 OmpA family protein [Microtetraspora sp. AC03309]